MCVRKRYQSNFGSGKRLECFRSTLKVKPGLGFFDCGNISKCLGTDKEWALLAWSAYASLQRVYKPNYSFLSGASNLSRWFWHLTFYYSNLFNLQWMLVVGSTSTSFTTHHSLSIKVHFYSLSLLTISLDLWIWSTYIYVNWGCCKS